jgi:type IX secretion system PorP/SprF family membrane protein
MKLLVSVCLLLSSIVSLYSQQLPKVYNQFFMNPYVYNPAYAGVEGHTVLFFMYKNQWGNIDGAPTSMHANFHVPLKGGLSLGGLVENHSESLFTESTGKMSLGYLVTLDREHFLRFGMSLGGGTQSLNLDEFDSPNDPIFQNYLGSNAFLIGDVGATYHFGHFNFGISLPQLFNHDLISDQAFTAPQFKPTDNILLKMNFRGHLNDNIAIEPHLIYRHNKYLPNQIEAAVILHVLHIVWVGGSYRQDAGAVGLLGIKLKEKIGIGYSYEMGNTNISGLLGPSHELHIGYHLGSRKDHAEHVSSFIKSHRKSAEERAADAELERQRNLQALQNNREAEESDDDALTITGKKEKEPNLWNYEKEDNLVERINENGEKELGVKFDRINEEGETEVVFSWLPPPPPGITTETYEIANPNEAPRERTRPNGGKEIGVKWIRTLDNGQTETLIVWDPIISQTEADKIDHNPTEKLSLENAKIVISAPEITNTEPASVNVDTLTEEDLPNTLTEEQPVVKQLDDETQEEPTSSEEHLEVKRGNHLLELPKGNHLIAGAFKSFDHAEDYSDELFERGFHDTRVGYITERDFYYVVIYESDNMDSVKRQRSRISNLTGLSKVWILKVN